MSMIDHRTILPDWIFQIKMPTYDSIIRNLVCCYITGDLVQGFCMGGFSELLENKITRFTVEVLARKDQK